MLLRAYLNFMIIMMTIIAHLTSKLINKTLQNLTDIIFQQCKKTNKRECVIETIYKMGNGVSLNGVSNLNGVSSKLFTQTIRQ